LIISQGTKYVGPTYCIYRDNGLMPFKAGSFRTLVSLFLVVLGVPPKLSIWPNFPPLTYNYAYEITMLSMRISPPNLLKLLNQLTNFYEIGKNILPLKPLY
jgi:hypothetical protein